MKKLFFSLTIFLVTFLFLSIFQESVFANLGPCPLDNPIYTVRTTDGNNDGVYHTGDTLTFEFEGYMHPAIIDEINNNGGKIKLAFIDFHRNPFDFENVEPIEGLTKEGERYTIEVPIVHNAGKTFDPDFQWQTDAGFHEWQYIEFEVSGTIIEEHSGSLAVHILTGLDNESYEDILIADGALRTPHPHLELLMTITMNGVVKDYWGLDLLQYPPFEFEQHEDWVCVPVMPERVFGVLVNIHLPNYFDVSKVDSNINDITNYRNTEKELIFRRPDGSLSFAKGINLVDFREQLQGLETEMSIEYNEIDNTIRARVNTQALTFLANFKATINFFGVAEKMGISSLTEENFRDYLNVSVYEGDQKVVDDISNYFDWSKATYNVEEDILSLPVNHFTEYVLGQAEQPVEVVEEEVVVQEELPETGVGIIATVLLSCIALGTISIVKKKTELR